MSSSLIGQTLGNKYEIQDLLGRGGMATVYKGYHAEIERFVAIKVLPPHPAQGPEFIERFQLEARTIARLQHPHILPVYDYGAEGDILYLAIAYIEGGSLADRIDNGPLPPTEIDKFLRETASALDYAHRQNVIHRDIKPDNVLLNNDGYVFLSDFGIAKLVGGDSNLTGTGGLVGTPAYMAPEQAQGGELSPAADIYALGVVVFEMLTGQQPYKADTPIQIMMKHVTEPIPRLSEVMHEVSPALEGVMARALAKDPVDRYATATAFSEAFSRAISGLGGTPTPMTQTLQLDSPGETIQLQATPLPDQTAVSTPTVITQPANNTPLIIGGIVIIGLLVIAVVALVVFSLNQNQPVVQVDNPTATVLAEATSVAAVQPTVAPDFGRATFNTNDAPGDTFNLRAEGMPAAAADRSYVVWLVNTESDESLNVGQLNIDVTGEGFLTFTDPDGRFLPGLFNAVFITAETDTDVEETSGDILFRGEYPAVLSQALTAILIESEAGINGQSLIQSALAEASLGERHGNLAASASNIGGLLTHTEHTINILMGTEEDYNGNDRGENPSSDKLGVPHFLDLIEAELDTALDSDGVSLRQQTEAELIRVCIENARLFLDDIRSVQDELLTIDDDAAFDDADDLRTESTTRLHTLVNGTDLNGNNTIEPFEGECSLMQIETFGVLAATMDIVEG